MQDLGGELNEIKLVHVDILSGFEGWTQEKG
jgi:hypothetical protein